MSKLFLSHRLDCLAELLAKELYHVPLDSVNLADRGIFEPRIIVVPNSALKTWIYLQIANWSQAKGIAGCKAMTLQEAVESFITPSKYPEIFFSLFSALADCQSEEIRSYLNQSPRRLVELANRLTGLFIRYGNICPSLFEKDPTTESWQRQLIQTLFVSGKFRLPVQMAPVPSLPPIHCFGFDYLPSAIWKLFNFRSIFLFSPCFHFWEDLCTERERKKLSRYWKKKGASEKKCGELDTYLTSAPPLLANWGRAGRETLKILDTIVEEIEEDYRPHSIECHSTLARLRERLLSFTVEKENSYPEDSSIQISKIGASRLREIENLRTSILRLIEEERLLFSDVAVFAPDIQPYASLIPFVFFDLPYRISGLEIESKSFFIQGMHRFFELIPNMTQDIFDSESLMALFENPAFYRARGWDSDSLEQIRKWLFIPIPNATQNLAFRRVQSPDFPISKNRELSVPPKGQVLRRVGDNHIETQLLDRFVYLFPEEGQRVSGSLANILEQFIEIYQSLRSDLASLQQLQTLSEWAKLLMSLMQKYFSVDLSDEADAMAWDFFKKSMAELAEADTDSRLFPFAPIQTLLKQPISGGQIHAAHLHAIRFSSITEGALTPVRALFLIGMDEESFPRRSSLSSLDLLKTENIYLFESADQDRYLFLQALFAANEFLHFSYSHLSSEGAPVNPCPLIEELIRSLDAPIRENNGYLPFLSTPPKASFHWPEKPSRALPEGTWTISMSDLSSLARHPWKFYLEKQFGIRLEGSEEDSFSRQKAKILRTHLQHPNRDFELPLGICGEALKIDLDKISKEWADLMLSWEIGVEPISFRMCCKEKKRGENGWEFPALEFHLGPRQHGRLIGRVNTFSTKGFIHAGNDSLEGLLRVWPECLASLTASGQREIYCLKSGKIKTVDQPEKALKAYILYYFLSQSAPSPLLTDWATPLLRKSSTELEKKMKDKKTGKGIRFKDPAWDWVIDRTELPSATTWFEEWSPTLREYFSELTALYPQRENRPLTQNAAV